MWLILPNVIACLPYAYPTRRSTLFSHNVRIQYAYRVFRMVTYLGHQSSTSADPHRPMSVLTLIITRSTLDTLDTAHTGCVHCSAIDCTVQWTRTRRQSIQSLSKHTRNTNTIYAVKIVNKQPRNLLNEIQNVFINGNQVKTAKITQIIPWFSQFYAKTTTGNSHAHMYAPTVTFARLTTPAHARNSAKPTSRAVKLGSPVGPRGLRLRPTRWQPESGSWWYKQVLK